MVCFALWSMETFLHHIFSDLTVLLNIYDKYYKSIFLQLVTVIFCAFKGSCTSVLIPVYHISWLNKTEHLSNISTVFSDCRCVKRASGFVRWHL